jgi:hypothetical protein
MKAAFWVVLQRTVIRMFRPVCRRVAALCGDQNPYFLCGKLQHRMSAENSENLAEIIIVFLSYSKVFETFRFLQVLSAHIMQVFTMSHACCRNQVILKIGHDPCLSDAPISQDTPPVSSVLLSQSRATSPAFSSSVCLPPMSHRAACDGVTVQTLASHTKALSRSDKP